MYSYSLIDMAFVKININTIFILKLIKKPTGRYKFLSGRLIYTFGSVTSLMYPHVGRLVGRSDGLSVG